MTQPSRSRRMRRLLFRLTLLGYPRSFRRAYGAELEDTFEAMWRAQARGRGRRAACALWWLVVRDGVLGGMRMRMQRLFGRAERADAAGVMLEDRRSGMVGRAWDALRGDARQTVRTLRREPGATAAVVLTLALGIGAATAIFSVVDAVLLRPLPFAAPERLVQLKRSYANGMEVREYNAELAGGLVRGLDVMESMGAHARLDMVLTGQGDARSLIMQAASPSLLRTLGRAPLLGRAFDEEEAASGARVLVLSHELWRSLGGDRDVLGRALELDGERYQVIGVMPPDFRFPTMFAAHAFLPLSADFRAAGLEHNRIGLVGRLRDGVTADVASQQTAALVKNLLGPLPEPVTWTAQAAPLGARRAHPNATRALWLVTGAVALLLLIAIMNATNLLLTRVSARSREFAVRHSLGASAARLLRQLIAESLGLALVAGAAAVALALAGVRVLLRVAPPDLTVLAANRVAVDTRVLLFAFGVTVATGLVLGVLPALAASGAARRRINLSLSPYAGATRERHRLRGGLVIAQVALAMTLLVVASLLTTSFVRIMGVNAGFDLDRTVLVSIWPNDRAYPTEDARRAFATALEERFAALPGVEAVARADGMPPGASFSIGPQLQAEGDAAPRQDSPELLPFIFGQPSLLPTLGTRLVEGRNFTPAETPESHVAIIDRDLARFFWGDASAVGRRFRTGPDAPWLTVVGVVDELMLGEPDGATGTFALLRPAAPTLPDAFFAIRTRGDAALMIDDVRAAIRATDPNQPVGQLWAARAAVVDRVLEQRFFMMLMLALGTVSLTLAGVGLYALLAFLVSRRRHELGVRIALGARAARVLTLIIRDGLTLAAIGIVFGLAGALAGASLIRSLLFGIEPGHPAALGSVTLVMVAAALLASVIPAMRAARVEPMRVLRAD